MRIVKTLYANNVNYSLIIVYWSYVHNFMVFDEIIAKKKQTWFAYKLELDA